MQVNLVVHRVEAKLLSIMNEQAAGLVFKNWPQRIARIFLPASKIVRNSNAVRPEF